MEGASKEARRCATCASIRLQRIVRPTATMIEKRIKNLTHRRGFRGGGIVTTSFAGAAALGFGLARRGVFEGAFVAFLTGMMCGNEYSREAPRKGGDLSIRGVRNDQ